MLESRARGAGDDGALTFSMTGVDVGVDVGVDDDDDDDDYRGVVR